MQFGTHKNILKHLDIMLVQNQSRAFMSGKIFLRSPIFSGFAQIHDTDECAETHSYAKCNPLS